MPAEAFIEMLFLRVGVRAALATKGWSSSLLPWFLPAVPVLLEQVQCCLSLNSHACTHTDTRGVLWHSVWVWLGDVLSASRMVCVGAFGCV